MWKFISSPKVTLYFILNITSKRFHFSSMPCKTNVNNNASREQVVRVRFAPSPTGQLHLGSIRTALYNYLFAKSHDGKFILRIEDTDQSRLVPGATEQLEEDLHWIGLHPDEGPNIDGPYGPYIQSKRLNLYKEAAEELLDRKAAYMCFCKESRLDLLRKDALRRRLVPRYDNRCRHINPDVAQKRALDGESFCVRLKMDGVSGLTFHDLVYGPITYGGDEGDPVIMKVDGFPTYHLANIVDDHAMRISHVLRGVEWQVSTPKHLLMFRALEWTPPIYGHLPLILNSDGSKLSKRQGDIQIGHYRENGILPGALLNYVTDAGGGFSERDFGVSLRIDELVSHFDINRVGTNSCRLRPDRLGDFNRMEMKRLLQNEESIQLLMKTLQDLVKEKFHGAKDVHQLELGDSHVRRVLEWGINRVHRLQDLVSPQFAFLWVLPCTNIPSAHEELLGKLQVLLVNIPDEQFTKDILKSKLQSFSKENCLPFGKLMKLIREEITGLKDGPGVAEMLDIIGKDNSLARLKRLSSQKKFS